MGRFSVSPLIVFGEAHLRRVLKAYASYYNQVRTHLALDKDAPEFRQAQPLGDILALPLLGGLHHLSTSGFEFSVGTGVWDMKGGTYRPPRGGKWVYQPGGANGFAGAWVYLP
jgi:sterol desaturase/sphingolipid hydroxylase (fatty acid hydroxylase superfamily)